jgi:EmrB/QacA subfamily drug resistance transporter
MFGLREPGARTSDALQDDRLRLVLPAIAIGTALAPLNSTMIAVALPSIQSAFGVSLAETTWLVVIYLVTMAVAQPICGRLGDMHGRRRMYLIGLTWFGIASAACVVAPSLPWLIVFRGNQALAGALCIPNGIALVRESVPVEKRGQSFGVIGMAAGTAAAAGPPLGGLLVHIGGWQAIFWANLPIIVVAAALAISSLPASKPGRRAGGRFDYAGSLLLGLSLSAIALVPLVLERVGGVGVGFALLGGVSAGWLFVWRERRASSPVVNLALFRHRHYAWACVSIILSNLVMYTTILAIPQLLEGVWNHSVQVTGLVLASMSAFAAFLGPVSGRWADSRGYWMPAVTGAIGLAVGAFMLAISAASTGLAITVISLVVMGLGIGIGGAPVQTAAVESVPFEQTASASGIFSTFRYLGSVIGSTLLALALSGEVGVGEGRNFTVLFAGLTVPALLGIIANSRVADRQPRA